MTRSQQVRRGAAALALVLLVAAITPFVVFAVPQVIGADEGFVVLSGSMEPALTPGDVVIVDGSAAIGVGDVITYRTSAESVPRTHRVVSVVDGGYETKGDANENADSGVVTPDAIVGRVVLVIPLIGHIILWTNTPVGYVALVVVPLVLLALNELYDWANRRRSTEETEPVVTSEQAVPDEPAPEESTVAISVIDLKLTLLAMGALLAYAGWNIYREVSAVSAPDPISVAAFTGGLLGLLLAASVTTAAWRAERTAASAGHAPVPARTDGGDDTGDDHE